MIAEKQEFHHDEGCGLITFLVGVIFGLGGGVVLAILLGARFA